jgi:hypothetical protein
LILAPRVRQNILVAVYFMEVRKQRERETGTDTATKITPPVIYLLQLGSTPVKFLEPPKITPPARNRALNT